MAISQTRRFCGKDTSAFYVNADPDLALQMNADPVLVRYRVRKKTKQKFKHKLNINFKCKQSYIYPFLYKLPVRCFSYFLCLIICILVAFFPCL
jgi:hypothetical protein